MFAEIVEFDQSVIVELIGRRCEAVMKRGVKFVPRRNTTSQPIETALELLDKVYTSNQTSQDVAMSRMSFYRLVFNQ